MKKNSNDFNIPFISPLGGSTVHNFLRVLKYRNIQLKHYPRLLLTFIVTLISAPFQLIEWLYFRNRVRNFRFKKPPVFIIGHWRSGTTHLHNLMCKDPAHGFVTTYQSVFPNNLLSKWIFKTFMKLNIPDKRPSDNVKLSVDYPQEEEFALSNMTAASFYHFFYFPSNNDELYKKWVRFEGVSADQRRRFMENYHELMTKAAYNTGKDRLIIKNPVNTGKVKLLLDLYPDAKFIYIHRDPVVTYLSTVKFFNSLIPTTCLEANEKGYVKRKIVENYKHLIRDYMETKHLIPKNNLVEIGFDELEEDNLKVIRFIYEKLGLETWETGNGPIREYIAQQKHYKKNKYKIKKEELDVIQKEWGFAMKEYNYPIPENLEVI